MVQKRWLAGGVLVLVSLLMVVGCKKSVAIKSRWSDDNIVIDGKSDEWQGGMLFDEETNTKIGVRNDSENLYFCFIFKDETIQNQVLQKGFTLWVCQDKIKNKLWGLRYPVGESQPGAQTFDDRQNAPSGRDGAPGKMEENPDEDRPQGGPPEGGDGGFGMPENGGGRIFMTGNDFELLDSEEGEGRLTTAEELAEYGISGKFSQSQGGGVIYEVQIPLKDKASVTYAAVPSKQGKFLIGFLSEASSTPGMDGGDMGGGGMGRGGMGEGGMGGGGMMLNMDGGGMGGGMGGGGGNMGGSGMGGGRSSKTVSSLELWTLIALASPPATAE